MESTSAENRVNFGLDKIDKNRTVEVNLRDLIFAFKTFEELIRFFHQPRHYQTLKNVEEFIGNKNEGTYRLIHQNYYENLQKFIPNDIMNLIEDGELEHPSLPEYFKMNE